MLGKPNAEYFDGTSAHSHLAHVTYDGRNLTISRDGHPAVIWRITEVELVSGGKRGQALRLKQAGNHGSRLTLPEGDLADRIRRQPAAYPAGPPQSLLSRVLPYPSALWWCLG
jgi:hypothetical protein